PRPVWKPMHLQPVFRDCEFFEHEEDIAAKLFERGICLPSGTAMTDEEQQRVINIIVGCFNKKELGKPI
ncbi:MAG TPA: pyridoxal phosphate-dependent aminotransferase, partial [Firmicutes bacterium]|nr:pyridoxal phosphate-dependent aminotransferase [Bacillota bacterium]